VLQGAWALLLGRWAGEDDVVFGATRAGRAGSVAGADRMVGCLINTLPVRVRLSGEQPVGAWLQALRDRERAVRPHDQAPLMAVQGWSEVGAGQPLFESLVVYDHQVLDSQMRAQGEAFAGRRFRLIERTNYPLTLYAYGEPGLVLKLAYDEPRFDAALAGGCSPAWRTCSKPWRRMPTRRWPACSCCRRRKRALLHEWNDTATPYPDQLCIHQAIEAQAASAARRRRGGVPRPDHQLRRAQQPRQPPGLPPAGPRRRSRRAGGLVRRARHRADGRPAGDPQGRRGVPAAGSGLSARAPRVHDRGRRRRRCC
jgi:non-ribosomal peptide synthetase component F